MLPKWLSRILRPDKSQKTHELVDTDGSISLYSMYQGYFDCSAYDHPEIRIKFAGSKEPLNITKITNGLRFDFGESGLLEIGRTEDSSYQRVKFLKDMSLTIWVDGEIRINIS